MLPYVWPPNDPEIHAALESTWADGSWGKYDGPHNEKLMSALAEFHGVEHVLTCSSGTFAVELALRALGLGEGDEVILAGYDFPGNFRCIETIGARPVLVDICSDSWCLDVALVEEAVGPRTKAIVVSHLHGGLAAMQALCELANRLGLKVVEDACQATGAQVDGRRAGTWGDVGVLSFGGSKLLTAGRGGAIMTRHAHVLQRAKIFCDRGNNAFPLSELQAAVIPPQLAKLEERNRVRYESVRQLLAETSTLKALQPLSLGCTSGTEKNAKNQPSFYKLAWLWNETEEFRIDRAAFVAAMKRSGFALDTGFRGFTGRSENRCRKPVCLHSSERAAQATIILHHPILLGGAELISGLANAMKNVIQNLAAKTL